MQKIRKDNKRMTNEKIKLLEKTKIGSSFAAPMASHELKNILAPIREGISIILDGLLGDINDKQRDVLSTVKNSADRLNRLIDDISNYQKRLSGKALLKIEDNDINEAVKRSS